MIERWIETLHRELDLTAEEIADFAWLAVIQRRAAQIQQPIAPAPLTPALDPDTPGDPTQDNRPAPPPVPQGKSAPPSLPQRQGIFPRQQRSTQDQAPAQFPSRVSLRVQRAPAVRDPLALMRALRPLMRQVASGRTAGLDEVATAERIADARIWMPVEQPALEPWLELALVIDESPSMGIWGRTVVELQRLLKHYGTFRDVRTWGLVTVEMTPGEASEAEADTEAQAAAHEVTRKIYLRPEVGGRLTQSVLRHPQELIDPKGRRLIWVVTDCVSTPWRDGSILSPLKIWADQGPLAIVQLLPPWMWVRTALRLAAEAQFYALQPGLPNQRLFSPADPLRDPIPLNGQSREVKVPVLTLEPGPLSLWSQMVVGKGSAYAPGVIFQPGLQAAWAQVARRRQIKAAPNPTPAQRVQRFKAASTPLARQLASLVAAVPVITLPIMQLIQQSLLPTSRQTHVAEVVLGGLLSPVTSPTASTNPDAVLYEFVVPQVRSLLLEDAPVPDTTAVLSQYVTRYLGRASLDAFIAEVRLALRGEGEIEGLDVRPFAIVAAEVLKRRGGQYTEFVREVEQHYGPGEDDIGAPEEVSFPELRTLDFETGQFVSSEPAADESPFPPLQTETVDVVTIEFPDDVSIPATELVPFTFQVATLEPDPAGHWRVRKQQRQAQRYIERLGNGLFITMVAIPGGSFVMGSPTDEPERLGSEGPQHDVYVNDFFMGRYPVTQAQWRAVAALPQVDRALNPNPSRFQGDNRPVERVSWWDAVEFCARLSAYTGRTYRLPSEAEWEYACRAGTTTPFHFGETLSPEVANYYSEAAYQNGPTGKSLGETTEVDRYSIANAFGLGEMHGNVWEWCQDHYHDSYEQAPADGSAWIDEDAKENASRILCGGSWFDYPRLCRSAFRNYRLPHESLNAFGLRVVCVVPRA